MKKVLFFFFLAGMLSSCSDDPDNSAFPEPAIDPASEYAVSPESALGNLELFLGTLQSIGGETRAGLFGRRVASILPLKTVSARTRSASASGVENLLYLVAFEDGQGSAILGADTRVNPVYAVLDETVLTPEDFESKNFDLRDSTGHAGDGDEEIRIKDFLVKIILDDVSDNLDRPADPLPGNGGGIDIGGGDWGDPTPAPKYRTAIINKTTQAPLLETKCDGYYWYDLFDTTKRLDSDKIDTGAGDYAGSNGSADYKFAYNFKMVVYDK